MLGLICLIVIMIEGGVKGRRRNIDKQLGCIIQSRWLMMSIVFERNLVGCHKV